MTVLTVSQFRDELADLINRVAYKGERVEVRRRGKRLAVLVSIDDVELLERLEDLMDVEAGKEALAKTGKLIPYEKVRQELGL